MLESILELPMGPMGVRYAIWIDLELGESRISRDTSER